MPRRALVVADDLTGAMDTGHELAVRGCRTTVSIDETMPDGAGVGVVNTDSRYAPPDAAREAVTAALAGVDAAIVYKKVDSTLRGNVAAEVEAAREATGRDLAIVAPAFPANGRLTAEGHHLVDGRPVTATAPGDDSKTPRTDHLPRLLAENEATPAPRVAVGTAARGADAVAERLRILADAETGTIACDAVHESHLAALAAGADRLGGPVVYAGSGGLARHIPLPDDAPSPAPLDPPPAAERRALAVVGSVAPATLDQLAHVPAEQRVWIDPAEAVRDPEAAGCTAAAACLERLADRAAALVTAATSRADVDTARAAGRERGLDDEAVGEHVTRALALTARAVWRRADCLPTDVLLTGGATAGATLGALDATSVELTGTELGVGVPVGRVRGGRADGAAVVTKAGAFGARGVIANYLRGQVVPDE